MGVRTIRVCDATGEELTSPVVLAFKLDGRDIRFEVNQHVANDFVLSIASRLPDGVLEQVLFETFGKNWNL